MIPLRTFNSLMGMIVLSILVITITVFLSLVSQGEDRPTSAEAYKKLARSHAKDGMIDDAVKEFEKAIEISYNEGYEKGKLEATRQKSTKIYVKYVILSIAAGLYFAAVFVAILWWSEISDQVSSFRRMLRIKGFIRGIKVRLNSDLRDQAVVIARSKKNYEKRLIRKVIQGLGRLFQVSYRDLMSL